MTMAFLEMAPAQVATDALVSMERSMARDKIHVNDRQLACARIGSEEGRDYLTAMACAANYAWVNRSSMTFLCRQAFAKLFNSTPDDLDMHVIYDVSHNIAKVRWLGQQCAQFGQALHACGYQGCACRVGCPFCAGMAPHKPSPYTTGHN